MTPNRIEKINAEWWYSAPFLSEFLLRFEYKEDPSMPTFGIGFNKSFVLYYNKDFMETLSDSELKAVLVHEIMHIVYLHTTRFEQVIKEGQETKNIAVTEYMRIYNYAADVCINERIKKDLTINGTALQLPKDCWDLSHKLLADYKGSLITENIYLYLLEVIPKVDLEEYAQGGQGNGSPSGKKEGKGEGEGEGENKENAGKGKKHKVNVFDDHSRLGELQNQEAKELAELIKYTASIKGWGSMGGNLVSHIKELMAPKKVPLQVLLRKMLQMLADGYLVKYDTYSRMNRRTQDMLPGKKKRGTVMNLIVDTSGSCFSEQDQKLFYSEIDYIANRVKDINLIQFDTEVTSHTKYKKGSWRTIKLEGSGGTIIQPVFDYLKQKKLHKYPTIVFTDGCFDWKIEHHNVQPLWVINNDSYTPTFGHLFVLDSENS